MDFFTFDTSGDSELLNKKGENIKLKTIKLSETLTKCDSKKESEDTEIKEEDESEEDDDFDYGDFPPPSIDISDLIEKALAGSEKSNSKNESSKTLDGFEIDMSFTKTDIKKELESSQLIKGIEKEHAVECLSERKAKIISRIERSKTKGKNWFNMPATEKTEEIENDLKILQMRSVLDPKHFYKKNDLKVLPKYFQVGVVQHSPLDYYSERDTRRNKKHTIVDELMADAEFQRYNKRKYKDIMEKTKKTGYHKALKKMKKLKKKK